MHFANNRVVEKSDKPSSSGRFQGKDRGRTSVFHQNLAEVETARTHYQISPSRPVYTAVNQSSY